MPNISGQLTPLGTSFPVALAEHVKGGFSAVQTLVERNAISTSRRRAGMLAWVEDTGLLYRLAADLTTWNEVTSADTSQAAALAEYALYDDFTRADVAAGGSLGSPVTGGDAWTVLTQGGVNPSSDVYLEDGALRLSRTSVSGLAYLVREFTSAPTIMGAEIVFEDTATPAGPAYATFCMSVTTKENGTWIDNLVHCLISESGLSIQTGFHGPNFIQHATLRFASGDIVRDRRYQAELMFDGSLAILRLDRWYIVARDPRIARNHGRFGYWEWYNEQATSGNRIAIHSVWTKRVATAPAREPARTSYAPPPESGGIAYAGGADRSVADMSLLTSLGISDFSVFWRGRMPERPAQIEGNATKTAALWCLGSKTTGPSLVLDYNTSLQPTLLFRLPTDGSNYRSKAWFEAVPGWPVGQVTDFTAVRRGATLELYHEGAYAITNYPDIETGTAPAWSASIASDNLIVGNRDHTTNGGEGWFGTIYDCVVANFAVNGPDMIALQSGIVPQRLKWATNTPLSSGESLTVGKCYRIGTVGTAGYWYTGCTAGDTIQVLSATLAIDLATEEYYSLLTLTANGSNTATQIGVMVCLGSNASHCFADKSTNGVACPATGATAVGGVVGSDLPPGTVEPNNVLVGTWVGQGYLQTNETGNVKIAYWTFTGQPGTKGAWI